MHTQPVLFTTTLSTEPLADRVKALIGKERQISWIPTIVHPDRASEIMKAVAKKISFFFPPPLIFVDRMKDYGRINEIVNWTPVFERCRSATIVYVSEYSRSDVRFNEEAKGIERIWERAKQMLIEPRDCVGNNPPRFRPITNPGCDWCRHIPFTILHVGQEQDALTNEQKSLVACALKPAPWYLVIQRLWSQCLKFYRTFI